MHLVRPFTQSPIQVIFIYRKKLLEILRINKVSLPFSIVVYLNVLIIDGLEEITDIPMIQVIMLCI